MSAFDSSVHCQPPWTLIFVTLPPLFKAHAAASVFDLSQPLIRIHLFYYNSAVITQQTESRFDFLTEGPKYIKLLIGWWFGLGKTTTTAGKCPWYDSKAKDLKIAWFCSHFNYVRTEDLLSFGSRSVCMRNWCQPIWGILFIGILTLYNYNG